MKTRIILIAALAIVLGALIWAINKREPRITILGNLTSKDIAEIKNLVQGDWRKQLGRKISKYGIKSVPGALKGYVSYHICSIDAQSASGLGLVIAGLAKEGDVATNARISVLLQSGPTGWQVTGHSMLVNDGNGHLFSVGTDELFW